MQRLRTLEPLLTDLYQACLAYNISSQLKKLKELFREDGIELTDAQALEIGLWLLARVRPIMRSPSGDKELLKSIEEEIGAIRKKAPFINLYEFRHRKKE